MAQTSEETSTYISTKMVNDSTKSGNEDDSTKVDDEDESTKTGNEDESITTGNKDGNTNTGNEDQSTKTSNEDESTKTGNNETASIAMHVHHEDTTTHSTEFSTPPDNVEGGRTETRKTMKNDKDESDDEHNDNDYDITYEGCYRYNHVRRDEDFFLTKDDKTRGFMIRKCYKKCNRTHVGIQKNKTDDGDQVAACFCLPEDGWHERRLVRDGKCGKRCSLEENYPCGGNSKDRIGFVSVFTLKAKEKMKTSTSSVAEHQPVDTTIGIAGGCIALFFVAVIVLVLFRKRYWKRKGRNEEFEGSDVYDHVDYNEIATSCSLEGSSNVHLLNRAYMTRRLDKTRHVSGSNSPRQARGHIDIPEVDENAYHRLEEPLVGRDHSYLTPRDMIKPPTYLEVISSSPRLKGRGPNDVLPDIPGVREALSERISGQYYIVEKYRNIPEQMPMVKVNGIADSCSPTVTEVKFSETIPEIVDTERKYVNEVIERTNDVQKFSSNSGGKDKIVYENEVCRSTNHDMESKMLLVKTENEEKYQESAKNEICKNTDYSKNIAKSVLETENQSGSKSVDEISLSENEGCQNKNNVEKIDPSSVGIRVDKADPLSASSTNNIGISDVSNVVENSVDDSVQTTEVNSPNGVDPSAIPVTESVPDTIIIAETEKDISKLSENVSIDEIRICEGNGDVLSSKKGYENIANVERNQYELLEKRTVLENVTETATSG